MRHGRLLAAADTLHDGGIGPENTRMHYTGVTSLLVDSSSTSEFVVADSDCDSPAANGSFETSIPPSSSASASAGPEIHVE